MATAQRATPTITPMMRPESEEDVDEPEEPSLADVVALALILRVPAVVGLGFGPALAVTLVAAPELVSVDDCGVGGALVLAGTFMAADATTTVVVNFGATVAVFVKVAPNGCVVLLAEPAVVLEVVGGALCVVGGAVDELIPDDEVGSVGREHREHSG